MPERLRDRRTLPETHYARSGEARIAYQVLGQGPFDLVLVPGFISNLDHGWDEPALAGFLERLASFCRLIVFDKRGTGLSDREGPIPTLEERMDDVRAVMDAAGSSEAVIFGLAEGGAMAMLFAATYPERTRALVLYGAYGHFCSWVLDRGEVDGFAALVDRAWGSGETLRFFAPSRVQDEDFRRWWGRFERSGASPSSIVALIHRYAEIDVRSILPAIRVRTLVLHRSHDGRVSVEAGRYLGRNIPNATYVELAGQDHLLWAGDADQVADEVEHFLTGSRHLREPDRVLATVLFTDIVGSTRRAEEVGDRRWRSLLSAHDEVVREEIRRFRGRAIKTLGDGFLATFDGPARAVHCAGCIIEAVRRLGLEVRTGLHTGEVEVSGDDVTGISVHIAARIAALAGSGQILVSRTVRDLVVGSGLCFSDRGVHAVKGVQKQIRVFEVRNADRARR